MIERNTNAGSPDERYKLLGQENLKFWHTRLLSPGAGSAATSSDMHPVWSLILEDIRASGYEFRQSPPGLPHTIQLHIQQAATSIGNLWSGSIYEKSFKYLAMNALRLRLAPNRFRKWQSRGRAHASANDDKTTTSKKNVGKMSRSHWNYLVAQRLDELAEMGYREDLTDEKIQGREIGRASCRERVL